MLQYYWNELYGPTSNIDLTSAKAWLRTLKTYDPETHDLVEKKEAKIKRLNEELSSNEASVKIIDDQIMSWSKRKSELIIKNNEIKEELKSLE